MVPVRRPSANTWTTERKVILGCNMIHSLLFTKTAMKFRMLFPPHTFNQNLRRLRAHDAGIGELAGAEFFAQLAAADRYLLVALGSAVIDQADPAQLLVICRETNLHRLDQQLALELVELALGGQAVPDVFAVVIRGVGVLAADDDVGEAEVLAIDGVHDRFLRAAVKHLDVQTQQDEVIVKSAADFLPQLLIQITVAEGFVVDKGLVGAHARFGIDIVALDFADERIEDGAGEMPFAREPFHAGDQGIFMGAVQGVARLKSDDSLPATLLEERPRFARRQHVLAILRMFRLRQNLHFAAQEHVALVAHHHFAAWMIGALGLVNALDVLGFVPGKNIANLERADEVIL